MPMNNIFSRIKIKNNFWKIRRDFSEYETIVGKNKIKKTTSQNFTIVRNEIE